MKIEKFASRNKKLVYGLHHKEEEEVEKVQLLLFCVLEST